MYEHFFCSFFGCIKCLLFCARLSFSNMAFDDGRIDAMRGSLTEFVQSIVEVKIHRSKEVAH